MRNPDRIDEIANILAKITNDNLTIMDILVENNIDYNTEDDILLDYLNKYPIVGYNIQANRLCYLWKMNYPDLRFGQLIFNIIRNPVDISDSILVDMIEKGYNISNEKLGKYDVEMTFLENFN